MQRASQDITYNALAPACRFVGLHYVVGLH